MSEYQRKIELIGLDKSFGGVHAVNNVDFTIERGSIHALAGENGAGKSTLMKMLAGVYIPDKGKILIDGEEVKFKNPHEARLKGISFIEQEFSLFPELSVYRNIFINREYSGRVKGLINWKDIIKKSETMLSEMGFDIDVTKPLKQLTTSEQQVVEIAKSIFFGAEYIIMDEPTSSMGDEDRIKFFDIIRTLKQKNVGIIYISHRMNELHEIADKVTVMRDGAKVDTSDMNEISTSGIVKLMVGRELDEIFNRKKQNRENKNTVLKVRNLTRKNSFSDISFNVQAGEIVGFSGLMGSQRTEIARCIYGLDSFDSGEILLNGNILNSRSPMKSIQDGIVMVPEDRKRDGIVGSMSVKENIVLSIFPKINKFGWLKQNKVTEIFNKSVKAFNIKYASENQLIVKLSGGNQQKCILAKCLALKPKLLILDEPTRGIDIGAKEEVHKIINQIAAEGVAILLISSEMPEILGACDRIIVLHSGRITDTYSHEKVSQEALMVSALK